MQTDSLFRKCFQKELQASLKEKERRELTFVKDIIECRVINLQAIIDDEMSFSIVQEKKATMLLLYLSSQLLSLILYQYKRTFIVHKLHIFPLIAPENGQSPKEFTIYHSPRHLI